MLLLSLPNTSNVIFNTFSIMAKCTQSLLRHRPYIEQGHASVNQICYHLLLQTLDRREKTIRPYNDIYVYLVLHVLARSYHLFKEQFNTNILTPKLKDI